MAEWWDWTGEPGPWESNAAPDLYAGGSPTFNEAGGGDYWQSPGYQSFTGWGDPTGPGTSGDTSGSVWGSLGGLASGAMSGLGGLLSGGAGGPLLSALGALGGGAIGSNAANEAARLQAAALGRGLDLQTAQWLQQQGNLAPYLQAGQGGLAQLQQLAGREAPQFQDPAAAISGANYQLPSTTPGWQPQMYQGPQGPHAADYRWTPQAGPQAANFRYTPGAVPTLSGQELLANDPGVAFRLGEGRKALEASAAARGGLLSGGALAALQRQGQELGSQEYGQAWNRASQQAQLREQWNQTASQLGWSQAESEARFREAMAQAASQQGFGQALAGQQNQFAQGLQSQQWNQRQAQQYETDLYGRQMEQSKYRYGQDLAQNQTEYERANDLYKKRMAAFLLPYEQQSTLANLGGQAVGMYGQQGQGATNAISNLLGQVGTTQAGGATNQANSWVNALQNASGAYQGWQNNTAYQQGMQAVLGNLNR